ncbi:MAG: hypothetical protein ONB11_07095 [candidate division KSB1 bacterium]|nr:hypothetical protein [candidate division KSB1 bacterium]
MNKWIVIANISEAFSHSYNRVRQDAVRISQILEDQYLGERALLWGADHKCVVTSWPVESQYLDYLRQTLAYSELVNIYPSQPSLSLCEDVLHDPSLLSRILDFCHDAHQVYLIPYSTTRAFLDLADHLVDLGLPIETPESCRRENLWLRDYIDSKGGFRDFAMPLKNSFKGFQIPEGFWARSWEEAIEIVLSFLAQGRSCVCKPNRGEGGAGIVRFSPSDFKQRNVRDEIRSKLYADDYLQHDTVIIEEYIEPDRSIAGGSPSVDFYIGPSPQSDIRILSVEAQVLSPEGIFQGVMIGKAVLPSCVENAIISNGELLARRMKLWGYVGPFDIDMVLDCHGQLWPVESNTRRTGASHAIDVATYLFGDEFWKSVTVFTFDHLSLRKDAVDFNRVRYLIKDLLYPIGNSKFGVLLDVSASMKIGNIGYLIFAESKEHAISLHEETRKVLETI